MIGPPLQEQHPGLLADPLHQDLQRQEPEPNLQQAAGNGPHATPRHRTLPSAHDHREDCAGKGSCCEDARNAKADKDRAEPEYHRCQLRHKAHAGYRHPTVFGDDRHSKSPCDAIAHRRSGDKHPRPRLLAREADGQ